MVYPVLTSFLVLTNCKFSLDLDFGRPRRYRSNTAVRLQKMDEERKIAANTRHIRWEKNPVPLTGQSNHVVPLTFPFIPHKIPLCLQYYYSSYTNWLATNRRSIWITKYLDSGENLWLEWRNLKLPNCTKIQIFMYT